MSYDITSARVNARSRATFSAMDEHAAAVRGDFLRRLDQAEFEVGDFEAEFIGNFLKHAHHYAWTDRRREACDRMMVNYLHRLPPPKETSTTARYSPATQPGHCSYLVTPPEGGPQVRCNKPAVERTRLGGEYCADHQAQRAEFRRRNADIKRRRLT